MVQEYESDELKKELIKLKDLDSRKYKHFTSNFYVMRAALRYFGVRNEVSFTASKVSDNFPISVPVAGSCLNVLRNLDVVSRRTVSSSPDLYLPQSVDLDRLEVLEGILKENCEIDDFKQS